MNKNNKYICALVEKKWDNAISTKYTSHLWVEWLLSLAILVFVKWLVGRVIGWLTSWLTDWLIDWIVCWLIGWFCYTQIGIFRRY